LLVAALWTIDEIVFGRVSFATVGRSLGELANRSVPVFENVNLRLDGWPVGVIKSESTSPEVELTILGITWIGTEGRIHRDSGTRFDESCIAPDGFEARFLVEHRTSRETRRGKLFDDVPSRVDRGHVKFGHQRLSIPLLKFYPALICGHYDAADRDHGSPG
jgi:hypothetical protein